MSDDPTKMKEEDEEENEEMEDEQEEEDEDEGGGQQQADFRCQLFVRFPCLLPPKEEIKALHPDIIKVFQKKQRKPKFCHLLFSTPEKARKAKEELSSTPYKNMGHLNVQFKDDPNRRSRNSCTRGDEKKKWLVIYGIPPTEPDANVREELQRFGCTHVHVYRRDVNNVFKKGSAKLIFNTVMDSEAFINNKELHKYKGSPIEVKYLKTGPSKGERKNQRRRERRKEYEKRLKNSF
ncbi:uncharacterized protein [Anabrus simplex]